ncbi:hypothetical protein AcW1_004300 [Taiwanofungus camphoratus]|nr:hypothetical protein AcW1_004300 [Antrodia cinnamomea]
MSSVRVKRGYTSLKGTDREWPTDPSRRRSRSLAEGFGAPHAAQSSWNGETIAQHETRSRALTAASALDGDERRISSLRRAPSKVSHHIMRSRRRARRFSRFGEQEAYSPFLPPQTRHSYSLLHHDRDDMISLEGPHTEVLIPADEREPGRIGSSLSLPNSDVSQDSWDDEHHPDDIVEHLDVIDPQIATVSNLTNAANAIVIPPLSFYSRKSVVVLPRRRISQATARESAAEKGETHGIDEDNLDLHVEDVLRKKDRFRRVMQGVWSFVRTPLGIVTAIYGFLVVFWGCALVFFLARFINVHNDNTQKFWIEICQQVLTSLFSFTSIGLIPFRVADTYRICKIWHYQQRTAKLRKEVGLPELYDANDLPDPVYDRNYVPVLTEEEQIDLHYQQHMLMQSQTWYRPHGTQTHRAFPIHDALLICVMNDLNSFFQCILSGCMWGLNRIQRPAWTTAVTLPMAFLAGIFAAFFIYWGSRKTKRVKEVTERLRQALAMEKPSEPPSTSIGDDASEFPDGSAASQHRPQRRDFAGEFGTRDSATPTTITRTSVIRIVDEMTVPAADALSNNRRGQWR